MIRAVMIAAAFLCAAGIAVAQPNTSGLFQERAQAQTGQRRVKIPDRVVVQGVYQPRIASASITCGATSYMVSVEEGACNRHYPVDSDGQPLAYDYAQCQNPQGHRAAASCRYGCAPTTGTGRCEVR
jgi:hypothetical protein